MRFPADVPTLTDGVVTLRAHRPDDVPALLEQAVDPLMVQWTTVPVPASEDSAHAYATRVVPEGWTAGTRRGSAAPSSCVTTATAVRRSRTARIRGRAGGG
jgi:hypothetical protein